MPSGIFVRTKKHNKNIGKARKEWCLNNKEKIRGKNAPNYKDGRSLRKYYCLDCGKELSNYLAKRCSSCARKQLWQDSEYRKIQNKTRNKSKIKEKHSIKIKQAWQNGCYDCVFKSPTKPEKEIMRILKELGLDYIFQYRPDGYSKPYDFYIPIKNLLVEFDGVYWHSRPGAKERDKKKTQYAINNNYNLLRLNEYNIDILEMILKNFINLSIKYKIRKKNKRG